MLLPTLGVIFAAFCVWLTVRIVNRRERWAKWTAVAAVGGPVLYFASFGPACWIVSRTETSIANYAEIIYWPVLRIAALDHSDGGGPFADAIRDYASFGISPDSVLVDGMLLRAYLALPYHGPVCGLD